MIVNSTLHQRTRRADGPQVDNQRWGGGIPLLLSGPGANRLILQNATDAQLADYGFNTPNLLPHLPWMMERHMKFRSAILLPMAQIIIPD